VTTLVQTNGTAQYRISGVDGADFRSLDDDTVSARWSLVVFYSLPTGPPRNPTIFVGLYVAPGRGGVWPKTVDLERIAFGKALKKGVMISDGAGVGGYAWTENQAQEFAYMVRYGMSPMPAIKSATSVAAQLLDQDDNFGTIEAGKLADIVC